MDVCHVVLVPFMDAVVAVTVMRVLVCVECVYAESVPGCDGD